MKKKIRNFIATYTIFIIVLTVTVCGNNDDTSNLPTKTFTVTFDADNGTENISKTVNKGDIINKPATPYKAYNPLPGLYLGAKPISYIFVEWQKLDGSAWDFNNDIVTADITLKAKWTTPSSIDITDEDGNNIIEKTVSYINANSGNEYTLIIGENIDNVAPQKLDQADTTLTITSDGNLERKITLGSNGNLFYVGEITGTVKLIIEGNITLVGKEENNDVLIYIINATFHIKDNVKITGNKSHSSGGVYIFYGGTFIMEGGEISNNSSRNNGSRAGGVAIRNNSTFLMKAGAKIVNNTGEDTPGGVYIGSNSSFIMEGGEISNNSNTNAMNMFGNIYVTSNFIMNDGVISGNSCYEYSGTNWDYSRAGGVFIWNNDVGNPSLTATFSKTGGIIYGYNDGDIMSNKVIDGSGLPRIN